LDERLADDKIIPFKKIRTGPDHMNNHVNGDAVQTTEPQEEHHWDLDPKIQDALGRALKTHYDDLMSTPVPDRFLVLLAELEAKENTHGG
jgi:hypothetical protein